MSNPFDQQKPIEGIDNIIAVSSGKGGVGKSTVTAQLAAALAHQGHKVGILDADIYGPSIPRMLGALHQKPEINEDKKMHPIENFGIRLMSIGFLIEEDAAVVWRGPMLFKAIDQFLRDVAWGELDYLLIDMPPGTGDVPLTLAQKVPLGGAVVVTTPQNIALADVKKAIDMFQRLGIPILGLVENMAYFKAPGEDKVHNLFPKGDLNQYLEQKKVAKLVEIPFAANIAMACESGLPLTQGQNLSTEAAEKFLELAEAISHPKPQPNQEPHP